MESQLKKIIIEQALTIQDLKDKLWQVTRDKDFWYDEFVKTKLELETLKETTPHVD